MRFGLLMHNRLGMKAIAQALIAVMVAITPIASAQAELDPDKLFDLVEICENTERAMRGGVPNNQSVLETGGCLGFIHGFLATQRLHGRLTERQTRFCAPAPFKITDLVFIFNAFIRKQPSWRVIAREKPALALVAALQDSWPCPGQ